MPTNRFRFEAGVLLISPDEEDHNALRKILSPQDWTIYLTHNLAEGARILRDEPVAAVLTDSRCWKDLLPQLWSMEFPPALVVADRLADERLWGEVLNLGGYDLLTKPFQAKELLHVLRMACRRDRTSQAYLSLRVRGCSEGQPVDEPTVDSIALAHP